MECLVCQKEKVKTNVYNSYKKIKENLVCFRCKDSYLISLHLNKIPIKKYFLWNFYLIASNKNFKINEKIDQLLRPLYLIADNFKKTVLVFDNFPEDNLYEIIDKLCFGDIILITYKSKKY